MPALSGVTYALTCLLRCSLLLNDLLQSGKSHLKPPALILLISMGPRCSASPLSREPASAWSMLPLRSEDTSRVRFGPPVPSFRLAIASLCGRSGDGNEPMGDMTEWEPTDSVSELL